MLVNIIKQYKNLKHTIKQLGWGMKLDGVDGISYKNCKLQTKTCKITKKHVFKRYLWYYEYKKLFCDYPRVNLFILIKSQQPTCCNSQIVHNSELEGYNKDF